MVRGIIITMLFVLTGCSSEQSEPRQVEKVCTQLDSGSTIDEVNLDGISDQELLAGVTLYCPDYITEVEAFIYDRD
jgi:hypothetical protein